MRPSKLLQEIYDSGCKLRRNNNFLMHVKTGHGHIDDPYLEITLSVEVIRYVIKENAEYWAESFANHEEFLDFQRSFERMPSYVEWEKQFDDAPHYAPLFRVAWRMVVQQDRGAFAEAAILYYKLYAIITWVKGHFPGSNYDSFLDMLGHRHSMRLHYWAYSGGFTKDFDDLAVPFLENLTNLTPDEFEKEKTKLRGVGALSLLPFRKFLEMCDIGEPVEKWSVDDVARVRDAKNDISKWSIEKLKAEIEFIKVERMCLLKDGSKMPIYHELTRAEEIRVTELETVLKEKTLAQQLSQKVLTEVAKDQKKKSGLGEEWRMLQQLRKAQAEGYEMTEQELRQIEILEIRCAQAYSTSSGNHFIIRNKDKVFFDNVDKDLEKLGIAKDDVTFIKDAEEKLDQIVSKEKAVPKEPPKGKVKYGVVASSEPQNEIDEKFFERIKKCLFQASGGKSPRLIHIGILVTCRPQAESDSWHHPVVQKHPNEIIKDARLDESSEFSDRHDQLHPKVQRVINHYKTKDKLYYKKGQEKPISFQSPAGGKSAHVDIKSLINTLCDALHMETICDKWEGNDMESLMERHYKKEKPEVQSESGSSAEAEPEPEPEPEQKGEKTVAQLAAEKKRKRNPERSWKPNK